jgi:hypothetical protein
VTYPPPVGVWKSSPARRLLWATEQTLHRLTREIPEQPEVDGWTEQLDSFLRDPVLKFDWEAWHATNVAKADEPEVPDDLEEAWASIPETVRDELWPAAGLMRTSADGLPFDAGDLDEALAGTFEQVRGVTDTTRDAMRNLMRIVLEEETGQFEFARRIREEWPQHTVKSAERIAVTEWNRGASAATHLGMIRQGVERKRWFNVGDERVCSVCEANAADAEVPVLQAFASGVDYPPAHPLCRCNVSTA